MKSEKDFLTNKVWDVIVIGGGPSGMMAAGCAAMNGATVLLLEKNRELGRKLLLTGGGRCNIFKAEENEKKLLSKYGEAQKFLHSPFSQHGMKDSWSFFESLGLPIVVEARKRAFPKSQKASDVLSILKKFMIDNGVKIRTAVVVDGFKTESNKIIELKTSIGSLKARSFVLATGGKSYPETGSTGEGLIWLKNLGHTVYSPNPNLVPLMVKENWVKKISGTSLSFMKITFAIDREKLKGKFSKTGKLLFTHFGISGPLVLDSSHDVKKLLQEGPVKTEIDLYPDTDLGSLRRRILNVFEKNKNKDLKNVLPHLVPEGLSEAVFTLIPEKVAKKKVHSIIKEEREQLADTLKALPLTVTGSMGFDWAIISDGGVDLKEVDTKTMSSKIVSNLYLTGDLLNIVRPSGGYSLQLCWTTGWVAGNHVFKN
jgi:predicted Rossmann fold flavoprotein